MRYSYATSTHSSKQEKISVGQAYATAKRIVSSIYTFIEGREENFLLIPVKCEEEGVPHLRKQQHNQ
jgi:hypothetical protein